jgi:predicted GNAT family acetyltransferase
VTDPPRAGAGHLRPAASDQTDLLVAWWRAFEIEAGVARAGTDVVAVVERRVRKHRFWVWDDDAGRPVAMVAANPAVAGVVRLGPVYTPPQHRRRGYAGAAVAAVSRQALQDGALRCTLFTDPANPTSNKIYAEVGYERLADWEEHEFTPR